MPTGAMLYVQVPNTTTSVDWERWRHGFFAHFADLDPKPETLTPDVECLDEPRVGLEEGWVSLWEAFPECVFLQVYFGLGAYYGPGYERGHLPDYIAYSEWLEEKIPESRLWYGNDSGGTVGAFDATSRAVLLQYYQRVGHQPYDASRESKLEWTVIQEEYSQLWNQGTQRVLREVGFGGNRNGTK